MRQNMKAVLARVSDESVVEVGCHYIVSKEHFEKLMRELSSARETLEITCDPKLFNGLLASKDTIDEDLRLGKLHSWQEVMGED